MDDRLGASNSGDEGMPRWVKVSGIVAVLLAVLVAVVLLVGGGEHGPSRHARPGGTGDYPPPTGVTDGHRPPVGGHG